MMPRSVHVLLGVACLIGLSAPPSYAADATADLRTIMSWWNGDYDNDRQVSVLLEDGKPIWRADGSGHGGHIEVASHYRTIDSPQFGDHVIYVEETKHDDPDNIFRQRIYTLTVDEALQTVRVKLWNFKDKQKYVGAWRNLSMLEDLGPEELSPLPDKCDLIAKKQGDKYHMPMQGRACAFGERYFNYQVLLGKDSFWFRDKIVSLADDEILESAGGFTYHELDKK